MKNVFVLLSFFVFLSSCDKSNDTIETANKTIKKEKATYCNNADNSIVKLFMPILNKDKQTVKADIQYGIDLFLGMHAQFREDETNNDKALFLKIEPSVTSLENGVEEMLISVHVTENPPNTIPEATKTIYEGTKAGAKAKMLEISYEGLYNFPDPCAPYTSFEWEGIWYVENCC